MTEIDVRCDGVGDGWRCRVRVSDPGGTSSYDVRISEPRSFRPAIPPEPGSRDIERLVRETFAFLLEREPRTSILSAFDLSVVSHYFPEYPSEIRTRLAR